MNEAVVNNMSIINGLNKVDGFDPSAFLRRLTGENGEEQFYLDVKYRKLWFRLMHPEGKITKRIIKLENEVAIIESRVYLNRNDAEDAYISCAFAQRWRKEDDAYGLKYVETAEMQKKASEQKKAEWDASMPVEELMQKMSLEDAKNYLIPIGAYKGKTLGELCVEKPGAINWYVESYHGKNNVLRAGAKLLLASVEK
ncbi:MAG: hypothetical protein EGR31_08625 [Clostridium sp.]|nr:hypothetical protein [Clostridium sp.]